MSEAFPFSIDSDPELRRSLSVHSEILRKLVGAWPFERGTQWIPIELGRAFFNSNRLGVLGGVGIGEVQFPFQPGDTTHPAFWFLYEKGVRRMLKRFLDRGSLYIDIGAHRGWHVGYALGLVGTSGTVIACEPHPQHASCLRQLKSLNPSRDLRICEVAVAAETGQATLLASKEEGWHTIIPEFNTMCDVPRNAMNVATITLDDLLANNSDLELSQGKPRVVIKIDAEGAELDILQSGANTLRLSAVRAIILECTGGSEFFEQRAVQTIELLHEAGWNVSVIQHSGLRSWNRSDLQHQVNLLALKN